MVVRKNRNYILSLSKKVLVWRKLYLRVRCVLRNRKENIRLQIVVRLLSPIFTDRSMCINPIWFYTLFIIRTPITTSWVLEKILHEYWGYDVHIDSCNIHLFKYRVSLLTHFKHSTYYFSLYIILWLSILANVWAPLRVSQF